MIFNKPLKDFIHKNQMKTNRKEMELVLKDLGNSI